MPSSSCSPSLTTVGGHSHIRLRRLWRFTRRFPGVIKYLGGEHRGRSMYLSKFLVAIGAGVFDAALNYLWDETVAELRRRIAMLAAT